MNILHVVNQIGYGGTEKNIFNLIKYSSGKNNYSVAAIKEQGPCFELFRNHFPVYYKPDFAQLVSIQKIDLVHIHRAGSEEKEFLEQFEHLGIPIVETNVFAQYDPSDLAKKLIKCHVLNTSNSLVSLLRKADLPVDYQFAIIPVAVGEEFLSVESSFSTNVVGRISREDNIKWHSVCVDFLRNFSQKVKVAVMGLTPQYRDLYKELGVDLVEYLPTADPKKIMEFYAGLSVYIHGSLIGETFGVSIAEAMMSGIPIVTLATPDWDNAQAELVDDGVNGFVCRSTTEYHLAVELLLTDKPRASLMGKRGREKARRLYAGSVVSKRMEKLYEEILGVGSR